jgi:hypothetical protein
MKKVACVAIFLFLTGGLSIMAHKGAYIEPNKGSANKKDRLLFYYERTEGARIMEDIAKDEKVTLGDLLPLEINGWKAEGKDEIYDPQTIFDYIDGAGEVYRSYNFKQLLARRFTKEGSPDIVADLFDMETSKDAFGVFTHDLEGEDARIGQGSTYNGGLLSFWKDRFFVSLYSEEETEDTRKALFALGEKVTSSIKKEGKKPDIVSFLPSENLVEKSAHYFHNHLILNYHFYVSDENILLLDQQTEAALGIYRENDEKSYILVVGYPEVNKASQAYKSFRQSYMPDATELGLVQTEDLKWTAAKLHRDFIIIIFNATSRFLAKEIIEKVEKRISQI